MVGGTVGGGFQADGGCRRAQRPPNNCREVVVYLGSLQLPLDEPMASKKMVIEYATQVPPNNCRKALVYRRELRLRLPRRCPRWCSSGMKRRARMRRRSRLLTGLAVPAS